MSIPQQANQQLSSQQQLSQQLLKQAQSWCDAGVLRPLDKMLAQFFLTEQPGLSPLELLAIMLCSEANGRGHVCLDLASLQQDHAAMLQAGARSEPQREALAQLAQYLSAYTLPQWLQALQGSRLVADLLAAPAKAPSSNAPFVLAGTLQQPLLYMRRYWQYEQVIANDIASRITPLTLYPLATIAAFLQGLFPLAQRATPFDWQMAACALALRSRFAIITGGPGTGKTTTVIKLLALLQGLRLASDQAPLNILLAAPTGKAAARLNESIAQSLQQLDVSQLPLAQPEQLKALLPSQVQTVHRLLGARANSRHFKHQQHQPLTADVVVIDEASMVDVELMTALINALPSHCHLYLLGDKDQLASVEAGSVLGDLCRFAQAGHYRPATAAYLQQLCAAAVPEPYIASAQAADLAQVTAMLRVSYRFKAGGAIHQLASLVNSGGDKLSGRALIAQINAIAQGDVTGGNHSQVQLLQQTMLTAKSHTPSAAGQLPAFNEPLTALLLDGYRQYLTAVADFTVNNGQLSASELNQAAAHILSLQRQFQLLAAIKEGDWGVQGLNLRIERLLTRHGLLKPQGQLWYAGRPVLMTRNDYHLKLMNGDMGVCLALQQQAKVILRVAFADGEGGIRWVLPSRLHGAETVFAMTVHKSQGSEFLHTALLLPPSSSPVLTRELLYTGITRAKSRFTLIYDNDAVLSSCIRQSVQRASGLLLL
ncbi:exodeoxyribonuclease V subunit alpha [Arsukibacterium sp.]|uniref:exodeoxyribonuclease V subunit alpha n=1 Tax=Arsukibacterium sp. TaxID=1977258 RepID=UPI002FD8853D